MAADAVETTRVVGEYESVGRHHYTRAVASEVDNGILHCVVALVELVLRELESILLHLFKDSRRQVVECPHSLVGVSSEKRKMKC